VVEYGKSLVTPSVFNVHAGNFRNYKNFLLAKTRPHKVANCALVSFCVFQCWHTCGNYSCRGFFFVLLNVSNRYNSFASRVQRDYFNVQGGPKK